MKFSRDATEPAFAAREVIAGKDARTLATEVLAISQDDFSAAFRKSPMKRAKLAGLQRNAVIVLADVYPADDVAIKASPGSSHTCCPRDHGA